MKKNRWVRLFFHQDTILLLFIPVWLWVTIGLLASQSVKLSDLDNNQGKIKDSQVGISAMKNKLFYKDTTWKMQILLDGYTDYFTMESKGGFEDLQDLYIGDTVRIYTRKRGWGLLDLNPRMIHHLERVSDHKVFVDFNKSQESRKGLWILTGLATVGFSLWYWTRVDKRMRKAS